MIFAKGATSGDNSSDREMLIDGQQLQLPVVGDICLETSQLVGNPVGKRPPQWIQQPVPFDVSHVPIAFVTDSPIGLHQTTESVVVSLRARHSRIGSDPAYREPPIPLQICTKKPQ